MATGNVKNFDFKSVGIKQTTPKQPNKFANTPIGVKTPLRLSQGIDLLEMHYDLADQIKDNLKNLLLTNYGERLGRYDYGGNLLELTFEFTEQIFDDEAPVRINTAVSRYMSFIALENMTRSIEYNNINNLTKVRMVITYSVPQLNINNQSLELSFLIGG